MCAEVLAGWAVRHGIPRRDGRQMGSLGSDERGSWECAEIGSWECAQVLVGSSAVGCVLKC